MSLLQKYQKGSFFRCIKEKKKGIISLSKIPVKDGDHAPSLLNVHYHTTTSIPRSRKIAGMDKINREQSGTQSGDIHDRYLS
jgi:hypothetical protein